MLSWWRANRSPGHLTGTTKASPARPAESASPRANAELAALQRACSGSDARLARQHVLQWAACVWPQSPPRGLQDLADRLGEERFAEPLWQLDRACYANAAWSGQALAQAFVRPPKATLTPVKHGLLPELYA